MSADTRKHPAGTLDPDLGALIASLPDSPDDIRERRDAVVAALEGFSPADNPLAQAMLECIAAVRKRTPDVVGEVSGPSHATDSLPELEFHQKQTMVVPEAAIKDAVSEARKAAKKPAGGKKGWDETERLLYEDVLCLFDLGDQPGAMTSMERLILLNPRAEELGTFMDKNGEALLNLYQEHFGSLERVPIPINDSEPVKIPGDSATIVQDVMRIVDGSTTLREIMDRSGLDPLLALCTLAHLARSGFIEIA